MKLAGKKLCHSCYCYHHYSDSLKSNYVSKKTEFFYLPAVPPTNYLSRFYKSRFLQKNLLHLADFSFSGVCKLQSSADQSLKHKNTNLEGTKQVSIEPECRNCHIIPQDPDQLDIIFDIFNVFSLHRPPASNYFGTQGHFYQV